ncbi:MAG: sugar transferase [Selenomonadales bacterium]|nr:sugar transferase [Selenomonadales bacterium]
MNSAHLRIKRLVDLFVALIAILLLSPLCGLIAILIKVESRGPVLFLQRRIGKDNTEFQMLKFRTMYANTPPNVPTHLLASPETYITKVGRVLRRTSLDELPQLINILRGDMSLVGPRPALWNQYDLTAKRQANGANALRPGITGWAQVSGRDSLSIDEKAQYDGHYAKHLSLAFDAKILFLTAWNVILARGVLEGASTDAANNHNGGRELHR